MSETEQAALAASLVTLQAPCEATAIMDRIIHQDMEEAAAYLPSHFVDLLFLDPPYNLNKSFNGTKFKKASGETYARMLEQWIRAVMHTLKPTASIYICGDWNSSPAIYEVASRYWHIRNRITWEREKGRGALSNWKNCSEDIWFCTVSDAYYFNAEAVKLKRKVIAPYRSADNMPKDWDESEEGKYRLTHPSNLWTDITVPFWSMPENTEHPTQKPEKLLAKLLLASSKPGDVVLDPFLGSGTTAATAKKLQRHFVGIEREEIYGCMALKRLEMANNMPDIQGYSGSVFWERNSGAAQKKKSAEG